MNKLEKIFMSYLALVLIVMIIDLIQLYIRTH